MRPALHHLGHLPVWLLVLLQILQRLSVHTGKTPNEEQTVNILPSDHNILISRPDWSQPQVFNDFRRQFSFISTNFFTSPPRIFHTTHFHFPLSTFHVFSHPFSQDVLGWKCHEKRLEHQLEGNSGLIVSNNHNLYPLTS